MSLWSQSLARAQSTWGEKCAFYLDNIHIPLALHTLRHRLASAFLRLAENNFVDLDLDLDNTLTFVDFAIILVFTVFTATLISLATMSSWRNFFRRSPSYTPVSAQAPHVRDSDFSYITGDDIAESQQQSPLTADEGGDNDDGSEPDILFLKHHKYRYTLDFPAYAIGDGVLSVGQLRRRAAEVTRTTEIERIKLLYKGKLLDDDSLACKAEGMKQESEVLCVVSEVQPGESSEGEVVDQRAAVGEEKPSLAAKSGNKKNNRKKGGKSKNRRKQQVASEDNTPEPPPQQHQQPPPPQQQKQPQKKQPPQQDAKPKISTSAASLPAPAPDLKKFPTALDQVNALSAYIRTELLPQCDAYITATPSDPRIRDFEHKKLSETILAQVILKADGIEPEGNPEVRNARRALVTDAQRTLNKLDQALKG